MPYFVYTLYSLKDNKLYVGCTSNIEERFQRHTNGAVSATKFRRPLEIIYIEKCLDKTEAFNRERFFKSLWSGRIKKKLLNEYKQGRASQQ